SRRCRATRRTRGSRRSPNASAGTSSNECSAGGSSSRRFSSAGSGLLAGSARGDGLGRPSAAARRGVRRAVGSDLSLGPMYADANVSLVAPAELLDATPAVLKINVPDLETEFEAGARALGRGGGRHAPGPRPRATGRARGAVRAGDAA